MSGRTVTNAAGALDGPVSNYASGKNDAGYEIPLSQDAELYRANAAVTKGQALMFVAPTATVPLSVTPMTVAEAAANPWRFAGVALEGGAAGDLINVCEGGFCVANHDAADAPANYDVVCLPDTATGNFKIIADPAIGDAVVGSVYTPEIGTANQCLVRLSAFGVEKTA